MASFSNADNDYNMKHPTLLHNRLYFTELEVCNAHKRVLHGGVNNTFNFTGNDYWLDNGRKTVRAILYKCVACKKSESGTLPGPEPSDHPNFCLNFDNAFINTVVDVVGPLYVKNISGKNNQMFKGYLCLFSLRLQGMFILNWHSRRDSAESKDPYLVTKRQKVGDEEFRDPNIFTKYPNETNRVCGNIDQCNHK